MKRIERDFIALFNCLWFQDFPVTVEDQLASRSDWTIHLGSVVRQCASLLGARALFEHGERTDAALRYPSGEYLTFVEWEWELANSGINEFGKLRRSSDRAVFQTFVGYSKVNEVEGTLEKIQAEWQQCSKPLLVFLITFELFGGNRCFESLDTYIFSKGKYRRERRQPALPWNINRRQFNSEDD
ncbi:hypothetical protein [Pseudomonas sp. GOM6]|uniref:hypothetical protein n=1 Tax=Pseudomonas sp. GOM6 TaxID=3036944 RepID=UPI002409E848|nr:hypothetical protein [Pseudomonas sp. GOM6]MDG1581017.1 hypothetical protein [Pseudomonas sp. GOM6]